ncbi:putative transposase [Paraburkholderia sp. EB58]|jgi:putative transposase|uniref:transposase n=1 Tax=Paraburkholderia sp. EB58 TaxID=3035125 RepID=UPI003D1BE06B
MIQFDDLTDSEWTLIEGLFCNEVVPPERSGRRRVEPRTVVNAVLWALSTGHGWSRVPGWYPSRPTCRRRFEEWQADGTLAEIIRRLNAAGRKVSMRGPVGDAFSHRPANPDHTRLNGLSWASPQTWRAPLDLV